MMNETFSPSSYQDWKDKAEESLKGKKLDSLMQNTYEDIVLKPLYSLEEQTVNAGLPGGTDHRRGIHALGYHSNPWKIAQKVSYQKVEDLKEKLADSLEKGQTALSFNVKKELFDTPEALEDFFRDFYGKGSFAVQTEGLQKPFLDHLIAVTENNEVSGYIAEDPISIFLVGQGTIPLTLSTYFDSWAEVISLADQSIPKVKTILIDSSPYHNGGANAVQELAVALATAVYNLQELGERGLELEKLFEKMIFKFQIGSNFFMELAKLRASRVLWDKIGEAYEIPTEKRKMEIIAETSKFTQTLYDPHVNILRSGNEAFAAVLGGVQYLQVRCFDELEFSTVLSERLARNTQLILKEETFLKNIVDPAGGSWYIESLTNELIEKAWEYFLLIEEKGGMLEVLESNWIQTEISDVLHRRQQDTFTRKQSIIGTNVYANLQEDTHSPKLETAARQLFGKEECHTIHSILPVRLAEPFESLRHRAMKLNEQSPIGLICLGDLKQHKVRTDFVTGLLAAGGLGTNRSTPISNIIEAQSFINKSGLKHFVICSSNDIYSELGLEFVKQLKQSNSKGCFYLAGLPEKDTQKAWLDSGIQQFIHVKTNGFEFLTSIMTELEEVGYGE